MKTVSASPPFNRVILYAKEKESTLCFSKRQYNTLDNTPFFDLISCAHKERRDMSRRDECVPTDVQFDLIPAIFRSFCVVGGGRIRGRRDAHNGASMISDRPVGEGDMSTGELSERVWREKCECFVWVVVVCFLGEKTRGKNSKELRGSFLDVRLTCDRVRDRGDRSRRPRWTVTFWSDGDLSVGGEDKGTWFQLWLQGEDTETNAGVTKDPDVDLLTDICDTDLGKES